MQHSTSSLRLLCPQASSAGMESSAVRTGWKEEQCGQRTRGRSCRTAPGPRPPATRYNIASVRPRPPARDCRCSNGYVLTAQRRSSARIHRLSERPPCRICTGTRHTPGTFSTLQQTTSTWQPIFDHLSMRACVSSVCIRCAHSRDVPVPHLCGCSARCTLHAAVPGGTPLGRIALWCTVHRVFGRALAACRPSIGGSTG
jgi:hypothetical protein